MHFKNIVFLQPEELCVTKEAKMITTVLGSCITLTMFDKVSKLAAMSHCVMPKAPVSEKDKFAKSQFKYVDSTIEYMIENFKAYKINFQNVELKLFGGGNLIIPGESNINSVGKLNVDMAKQILSHYNLNLNGENTGGRYGRKLFLDTNTGIVYLKTFTKII